MHSSSSDDSSDVMVEEYDVRLSEPSARHDLIVGLERKRARSVERRSLSFSVAITVLNKGFARSKIMLQCYSCMCNLILYVDTNSSN